MPIRTSGDDRSQVAIADPLASMRSMTSARAWGRLVPVLVSGGKILEVINKVYARQAGRRRPGREAKTR